jgi:hypothetical protein
MTATDWREVPGWEGLYAASRDGRVLKKCARARAARGYERRRMRNNPGAAAAAKSEGVMQ